VITSIKSRQKKLRATLAGGDAAAAKEQLVALNSALDKAAKRGIVHRNVANRRKSRLAKALAGAKAGK
jgi:small subunit ribosomal protein S20